jgi:hypothetical protein
MRKKEREVNSSGRFLWSAATYSFIESNFLTEVSLLNLSTCHLNRKSTQLIVNIIKNPDSRLHTLILDQCRLGIPSAMLIFRALPLSQVRNFSADGNLLTNEACRELAKCLEQNPPLECVSLRHCDLPAAGCVPIAASLPFCANLRFLWLDHNSVFDRGAERLAANLAKCSLVGLSLADNQIWSNGTNLLLKAVTGTTRLTTIDLSGNIIDLVLLSQCLRQTPALTGLAISRCKVNEAQVPLFLEELPNCQLTTLIVEGFNYQQLPISWPMVSDTIWTNRSFFQALRQAIINSKSLVDLRFGFLDLEQIYAFVELFEQGKIQRPIVISMSDFGRTDCCWLVRFPEFAVTAPSSVFQWCVRVSDEGASIIARLFRQAVFHGEPLEGIELKNIHLGNSAIGRFVSKFQDTPISLATFDLSSNPFGDGAVNFLCHFFVNSVTDSLNLMDSQITAAGYQTFFHFFGERGADSVPILLKFSFLTYDLRENAEHLFFADLAALVAADCRIEEIVVQGFVTAVDLTAIVRELGRNTHLKAIVVKDELPDRYRDGARMPPEIAATFADLIRALYGVLTAENSVCVLGTFTFPMLASVFVLTDELSELWGEIENRLDANMRK